MKNSICCIAGWLLTLTVLLLVGCEAGSGDGLDSNGNPLGNSEAIPLADNLASIQANIFTPNCALSGCHSGASPAQGLLLSDGNSFRELLDQASSEASALNLIEPGDADSSYLVRKIEGTAAVGLQMPRLMTPLTVEKIAVIRSWIDKGALGPTLDSIQHNIFTPDCTACHGGPGPAGGLNLEPGQAYENLVGVKRAFDPEIRVVAGDAGASFLIDKLEGNDLGGSRGDRMPLGGPYLGQAVIDVLREWIQQGAPKTGAK